MKSFENTFETPKVCLSCSAWLENHFSRLETKKFEIFLKIFFWKFFFWKKSSKTSHSAEKWKGGTLWDSLTFFLLQISKNPKGGLFWDIENFRKKIRTVPKKNWKGGGPFGVFRFCRLRKKGKKRKEGPFAVSLHWSNLAWVNLSVSVQSGTYAMSFVVWRKKKKKTSHCNSRAFFLKGKGAD